MPGCLAQAKLERRQSIAALITIDPTIRIAVVSKENIAARSLAHLVLALEPPEETLDKIARLVSDEETSKTAHPAALRLMFRLRHLTTVKIMFLMWQRKGHHRCQKVIMHHRLPGLPQRRRVEALRHGVPKNMPRKARSPTAPPPSCHHRQETLLQWRYLM